MPTFQSVDYATCPGNDERKSQDPEGRGKTWVLGSFNILPEDGPGPCDSGYCNNKDWSTKGSSQDPVNGDRTNDILSWNCSKPEADLGCPKHYRGKRSTHIMSGGDPNDRGYGFDDSEHENGCNGASIGRGVLDFKRMQVINNNHISGTRGIGYIKGGNSNGISGRDHQTAAGPWEAPASSYAHWGHNCNPVGVGNAFMGVDGHPCDDPDASRDALIGGCTSENCTSEHNNKLAAVCMKNPLNYYNTDTSTGMYIVNTEDINTYNMNSHIEKCCGMEYIEELINREKGIDDGSIQSEDNTFSDERLLTDFQNEVNPSFCHPDYCTDNGESDYDNNFRLSQKCRSKLEEACINEADMFFYTDKCMTPEKRLISIGRGGGRGLRADPSDTIQVRKYNEAGEKHCTNNNEYIGLSNQEIIRRMERPVNCEELTITNPSDCPTSCSYIPPTTSSYCQTSCVDDPADPLLSVPTTSTFCHTLCSYVPQEPGTCISINPVAQYTQLELPNWLTTPPTTELDKRVKDKCTDWCISNSKEDISVGGKKCNKTLEIACQKIWNRTKDAYLNVQNTLPTDPAGIISLVDGEYEGNKLVSSFEKMLCSCNWPEEYWSNMRELIRDKFHGAEEKMTESRKCMDFNCESSGGPMWSEDANRSDEISCPPQQYTYCVASQNFDIGDVTASNNAQMNIHANLDLSCDSRRVEHRESQGQTFGSTDPPQEEEGGGDTGVCMDDAGLEVNVSESCSLQPEHEPTCVSCSVEQIPEGDVVQGRWCLSSRQEMCEGGGNTWSEGGFYTIIIDILDSFGMNTLFVEMGWELKLLILIGACLVGLVVIVAIKKSL